MGVGYFMKDFMKNIMKKKKKLIMAAAVGLSVIILSVSMVLGGGIAAETQVAQKGEIRQYVEDTAAVQCRDKQTVYIEGSGKITDIKLDMGTSVKEGDLLLAMDTEDLELQLKDANAKVLAAQAQVDSTSTGSYASRIETAFQVLEQAKISMNSSLLNYERSKTLYESGAVSRAEFETAQDKNDAALSSLKTAEAAYEEIKNGAPDYIKKGYTAQLEQALVFRESVRRSIDKMQLTSPIDGVILEKLVEVNSPALPGTPAFIVGNTDVLELEANILSDDSYKVELGDEVEITGKFLNGEIIEGKVIKIAPSARTITSTLGVNQKRVQVIIEITGKFGLLKPGYNVDIKIVTAKRQDTVTVPDSALFDYKGGTCVFVVEKGKAVIRPVKKGLEGNKLVEIIEGLKEGETILIKPDNTIKEGAKIKAQK